MTTKISLSRNDGFYQVEWTIPQSDSPKVGKARIFVTRY